MEFYAVVTDRRFAEMAVSPAAAWTEIDAYLQSAKIRKLMPLPSTWAHLQNLVAHARIRGRDIHDLALAAVALTHGVSLVYTVDLSDFARIPGIRAVNPLAKAA